MCIISLSKKSWSYVICRLCYHNKSISINSNYVNYIGKPRLFPIYHNIRRMSGTTNSVFEGVVDRFHGVTVDSLKQNCKIEDLSTKLEDSLKTWLDSKKRAVWFKVALEHSDWVPVLAKNGFDFHHAKAGFVMMYKWLPDEYLNIPHFAHTMIGVGAIIINDKSEVLVVREKYGYSQLWKMPGGYVEPGENLVDAAIREAYEETGVHTEFHSLVNFRHTHNAMFDCSDIYIAIRLKPQTEEIKVGEREISEAKWLSTEEYLNNPNVHELNKFLLHTALKDEKNERRIDCKHGIHQLLKKPYCVYFMKSSNEKS